MKRLKFEVQQLRIQLSTTLSCAFWEKELENVPDYLKNLELPKFQGCSSHRMPGDARAAQGSGGLPWHFQFGN